MRSPVGVSFFSSGLANSPPKVEPLVAVEVPAVVPSFFSPSLGRPKRLVVVMGVTSFLSSGFVASLFVVVVPKSPPPVVPPVPPNEKPPAVGGTGVDAPEVSGFWTPNSPPPNAGVVVEVDVEVVALSAGLGGSPKNPPAAGMVVVVVADGSPAGLGGPPNNPPVVAPVLSGKRPPDVAIKCDQHRESEGQDLYLPGFGASLFSAGFGAPNNPPPKAGAGAGVAVPLPPVSRVTI